MNGTTGRVFTYGRWMLALGLLAGLLSLALSSAPVSAQAQGVVTPTAGSVGSTFVFNANGFKGDNDSDEDDDDAERVAYWINTPSGAIISQGPDDGDDDDSDKGSYLTKANRDGVLNWEWTAPVDAAPGSYVMVARGLKSGYEVTIPFEVR
jgi:hypothetical protein